MTLRRARQVTFTDQKGSQGDNGRRLVKFHRLESHGSGTARERRGQGSRNGTAASSGTRSARDGTRERGPRPGTGALAGGRPASTLPESPPGSERGSVRVNPAATAANTATLPRRPPERHGPARAAERPPSPWRPMGPDARARAPARRLRTLAAAAPTFPGRPKRRARSPRRLPVYGRSGPSPLLPARRGRRK